MDAHLPAFLPAAGLAIGLAFGAVSDWAGLGDTTRLKAWALAAAIAILGTQTLAAGGWVDPARSIHGGTRLVWLGHILGGALFGIGMTLAGGCASRSLARLGAGNLKSLVVVLVLGVVAMATMRGVLAPLRTALGAATALTLPTAQTLPELSGAGAGAAGRLALALGCALPLAIWALADRRLRDRTPLFAGAALTGGLVTAGWAATGILGADDFAPVPPASLTFVGPAGETIVYLMFATGSSFTFAIATCLGVVAGATASARMRGSFRWEGFATRQDLVRHIAGAAAMGCGAVLAGGCTIGQGVTAASAMALGAPLTVAGILAGGALATGFLAEGSWRAAWASLLRPRGD